MVLDTGRQQQMTRLIISDQTKRSNHLGLKVSAIRLTQEVALYDR